MFRRKIASLIVLLTICFSFYPSYLNHPIHAQDAPDVDCIARELAEYVVSVFKDPKLNITTQSSFGNIRFLSPAFNLTDPNNSAFVNQFSAALQTQGYSFNNFSAIAGNAYNMTGGTIQDWVAKARNETAIGGQAILLTEIGFYPPNKTADEREAAVQALRTSADYIKENGSIVAGLLFNVFCNNPDSRFAGHCLNQPDCSELDTVCAGHGNCGKIGANSATFYSSSDDSFYNQANVHGMRYALEIANNDSNREFPALMAGINSAQNKGMTPVLRLGVNASSGGFNNPEDLASFVYDLSFRLTAPVYLIIGSNEPLSECWATPECGCADYSAELSSSLIWPPDPAHFYVQESGNEDLIAMVSQLVINYPSGYPLPEPNPVIPPQGTGEWYFPIRGVIRITDDAAAHQARGVVLAWDFSAVLGTPIYPAKDGILTETYCDYNCGPGYSGYGCLIKIDHGNGWTTRYGHLPNNDIARSLLNQRVTINTVIGVVDNTGCSSGNHLHFEVRSDGTARDPAEIFGPLCPCGIYKCPCD